MSVPICPFDPGEIIYIDATDGTPWRIEVVGMEWRGAERRWLPGERTGHLVREGWFLTVQTLDKKPFRFICSAAMARREP